MFNIHLITTIVLFQTLDLDKQKKTGRPIVDPYKELNLT